MARSRGFSLFSGGGLTLMAGVGTLGLMSQVPQDLIFSARVVAMPFATFVGCVFGATCIGLWVMAQRPKNKEK